MTDRVSVLVSNDPVDWMPHGSCRGKSELFFAPFAERPEARVRREAQARTICQGCTVMMPCRSYARDSRELGFWGGESEAERAPPRRGNRGRLPRRGRRRSRLTLAPHASTTAGRTCVASSSTWRATTSSGIPATLAQQ
jgi:WhiB family redox-sensing transcriptional regulator